MSVGTFSISPRRRLRMATALEMEVSPETIIRAVKNMDPTLPRVEPFSKI